MSLAPGARVGAYEVIGLLGAGGMGEVFRARDSRLGRDVALKALPAHFVEQPDRLARFDREARILATLSHPNIAAIYGVEEVDGGRVLVLELAQGETLEERLARGRLPLEEVLAVAAPIVAALESAHEHGIVHRDLKPANVKVAADGRVKVLDFGLATGFGAEEGTGSGALSQSPTMSARMTGAGVLLGTAAYMSPEQARGKPVDKRADIWAFGAVLWEMICGRRLFEGETVSDLIAAVLRQEIDWKVVPSGTPPALVRLLRRCLERDPQKRLRDIGEARLVIDEVIAGGGAADAGVAGAAAGTPVTGTAAGPGLVVWWAWLAIPLVAAAAFAGWSLRGGGAAPATPISRLAFPLPADTALPGVDDTQVLALSRDGRTVVFRAQTGPEQRLWVRRLGEAVATPIPGTEGAEDPFLSPDGGQVAFVAGGKLRRAPIRGGPIMSICDAGQSRGGVWADDDTIVFAPETTSGLVRVPAAGGTPVAITTPDVAATERSHRWPALTPDGTSVLFTVGLLDSPGEYENSRIDIVGLDGKDRRTVYQGASMARVAASGHLLVSALGLVSAVPFDAQRGAVRGTPVPVLEGVAGDPSSGVVFFDVASDGTLAYVAGGPAGRERDVVWVDRAGKTTPIDLPPREYRDVRVSPDGTRLALSEGPGAGRQSDVVIHDLAHGSTLRLTSDGVSGTPVWTPDGQSVLFEQFATGLVIRRRADGTGAAESFGERTRGVLFPTGLTADGSIAFLSRSGLPTKGDILTLGLEEGGTLQAFAETPAHETEAIPSPDGRLVAYTIVERSDPAILVQSFPGPGGRWLVSDGVGVSARWRSDGRELYYMSGESLLVVQVTSTSPFTYGRPQKLIDLHALHTAPRWGASQYDVAPDGNRFVLLLDRRRSDAPQQINVTLNWLDEVRRLSK